MFPYAAAAVTLAGHDHLTSRVHVVTEGHLLVVAAALTRSVSVGDICRSPARGLFMLYGGDKCWL